MAPGAGNPPSPHSPPPVSRRWPWSCRATAMTPARWVTGPGDTVTLDPDVARACLYHDCDPATADWAIARLGPQPLISLRQQPWAVAWRTKPSTYVVCANDQAIHPVLQRILARRCITAV